MNSTARYLRSSVGRKQVMGLTGIYLYFFLLVHLAGNLGMLAGAEHFNAYGYLLLHTLREIIVPIECTLLAAFLIHLGLSFQLTAENRAARGPRYAVAASKSGRTPFSRYMMVSGVWLLIFLLVHVPHFRFGAYWGVGTVVQDGVEMRDLYGAAMRAFGHWWFTLFYVASFVVLFTHLAHGVQSSLQSLGWNHPKYQTAVQLAAKAYAVVICAGFAALAVWAHFHAQG